MVSAETMAWLVLAYLVAPLVIYLIWLLFGFVRRRILGRDGTTEETRGDGDST